MKQQHSSGNQRQYAKDTHQSHHPGPGAAGLGRKVIHDNNNRFST
jgi:hypothetical protein